MPAEEPTKQSDEVRISGGGRTDAKPAEKGENILDTNNATIISTFRIRADECDRLWVNSHHNYSVHLNKLIYSSR